MDKNLYMRYVILLVMGCIGLVVSIILAIYIYIKEDLSQYINFEFLSKFNVKKRFAKQKKQIIASKSSQLLSNPLLEGTGQTNDDTTLLNDDTTLLNDEK